MPGYLLFYAFIDLYTLAMNPTKQILTNGILPFSITLVNMDGLLVTDLDPNGVLTMNYMANNGSISNSMLTTINSTLAGALCWSTYSPMTENYYVIGTNPPTIVELNLNLSSTSKSVQIIQYYPLPNNTGAREATTVISSYRLNGPGNAIYNGTTRKYHCNT